MDIVKLIFRHHRRAFLLMLALTFVSGFLGIAVLSYINRNLLHFQAASADMWQFVLLVAAYFLLSSAAQTKLAHIGQNFLCQMQIELLKRVMDTPETQIRQIGQPRILASLNKDVNSMSFAFTRLPELVQGMLFVVAGSAYLLWLSPKIFLVIALMLVVMIAGTHVLVKGHHRHFRGMRASDDEIQRHYETVLDGHKELLLNRARAERFFRQEFSPEAEKRRNNHVAADGYHALAVNWSNSVMLSVIGVVFYLAVYRQWANLTDAATIAMTVLFMRGPLTAAIGAVPAVLQSQVGLQVLKELGLTEYREPFHSAERLPENWREIRLENVSYAYPAQGGQVFSLQPLNLTLRRGETVFLIGGNGSGKSTLSMVLAGLYTPAGGRIFVDDIEITDANREAYRQLFASVFTDFHLFEQLVDGMGQDVADYAVADWLAKLQLSDKARIEAGKILNRKLSQGQRKRLGLLAAALEGRSMMILDEWAADQDPQFRRTFYEELLPLLQQAGCTVFAISHDDKYFSHAQRILSMKQGRLSEYSAEQAVAVAEEHSRT